MQSTLEDIILGCIFFDDMRKVVILEDLQEDLFNDKKLFKKVAEYRKDGRPYDLIVAMKHFTPDEFDRLNTAVNEIGHLQNYPEYLFHFKKGRLELILQSQIETGKMDAETVKRYLSLITGSVKRSRLFDFSGNLQDYLAEFDERMSGRFEKYSFDLQGFDETLGSIRPKSLITIAANSGVGKTNMMLKIMLQLMAQDVPCLYITSEMGYSELVERMGAIASGIRLYDIRNAHLNAEQVGEYLHSLQSKISGKKSYIFELSRFNMGTIKNTIEQTTPRFVFVDYYQRFTLDTSKNNTRAGILSDIVNDLKATAMDMNVVVVGASQMKKNNNRQEAQIQDIKESGGIEEASDIVILLSDIFSDENFKIVKVDIAKNRHGITDKFAYVMKRKNCDMEYSFKDTAQLKSS